MKSIDISNKKRTVFYAILTIFIMVFIFVQSALTGELSGEQSGVIVDFVMRVISSVSSSEIDRSLLTFAVRKLAHFLEYTALGVSLMLLCQSIKVSAAPSSTPTQSAAPLSTHPHTKPALIAWLIGAAYAVTDEVHQYFVPERSCEIRDMLIDSAGVLLGVLIVLLFARVFACGDAHKNGK